MYLDLKWNLNAPYVSKLASIVKNYHIKLHVSTQCRPNIMGPQVLSNSIEQYYCVLCSSVSFRSGVSFFTRGFAYCFFSLSFAAIHVHKTRLNKTHHTIQPPALTQQSTALSHILSTLCQRMKNVSRAFVLLLFLKSSSSLVEPTCSYRSRRGALSAFYDSDGDTPDPHYPISGICQTLNYARVFTALLGYLTNTRSALGFPRRDRRGRSRSETQFAEHQ
jgi:hypothetical protein